MHRLLGLNEKSVRSVKNTHTKSNTTSQACNQRNNNTHAATKDPVCARCAIAAPATNAAGDLRGENVSSDHGICLT